MMRLRCDDRRAARVLSRRLRDGVKRVLYVIGLSLRPFSSDGSDRTLAYVTGSRSPPSFDRVPDTMRKLALIPLSAALVLSACGSEQPAPAAPAATPAAAAAAAPATPITGPKVSGSVGVEGVSSLPSDDILLSVRLLDVTDAASVPVVVSERKTAAPRLLPSGFEIGYDPARIDPSRMYAVEAGLEMDGIVLYGSPAATPVLTQGAGDSGFSLNLVQGGKPVATVAPPEQLKLDFKALEANLGALRRITGERLDEEVAIGWDAFVDNASGQVLMAREQVEVAEAGTTAYRFAYKGGQPWMVERKQGGTTTLLGWTSAGELILNEKGSDTVADDEVEQLKQRALALYSTAAARR
jgi:uncharacterized lipoprotein YbaY